MAISFARGEFLSRSNNKHPVAFSAYLSCSLVRDQNTDRIYGKQWLANADTVVCNRMLPPEGASPRFSDQSSAWSLADLVERRKNSQVAFHVVAAVDPRLTREQQREQAEEFARIQWVSKGLLVQYAIHKGHSNAATIEERENDHIHFGISTRRVEGDGFARHKARDLHPAVRQFPWGPKVVEADAWGKLWGSYQDDYFVRKALDIRVDPVGVHPQEHIGPRRHRHPNDPRIRRNEERQRLNSNHNKELMEIAAELSPKLRELLAERNAHRHGWHHTNAAVEKFHKPGIERAEQKVQDRWAKIGLAKRALHLTGVAVDTVRDIRDFLQHRRRFGKTHSILRDVDILKAQDEVRMRTYLGTHGKPVVKRKMHLDYGQNALTWKIRQAFDEVRVEALAVQARRQRFAELEVQTLEERLVLDAPRPRQRDTLHL